MALIRCPECKKKISDQCENCPKCGYPIKNSIETAQNVPTVVEEGANKATKKPFYKQVWFWIVAGVALVALAVGMVLLFTRDTQPKYDENGKPVFVELTNEVYTNAKQYLGYHVQIKGQVFQVMSDDGVHKGIQVWIDPETCEQNLMIYYTTKTEVKQGDYITCTGYIDSVNEYKNAYGATLYAPLVYSDDLKTATYIDVMAPTIDEVVPEKLSYEKKGYAITVNKVEFAKQETRVYVTVKNGGKATFMIGEAVVVQGNKQYNAHINYDAQYEEVPYELVQGVSASGIVVFPAMSADDFKLTFKVHSGNYEEELGNFVFGISKDRNVIVTTTTTTTAVATTTKKTTVNRNKEALTALERHIGQQGEELDRASLREFLQDKGYTDKAIEYAISNIGLDWFVIAEEQVRGYQSEWSDGVINIGNVRSWLEDDEFTNDEINMVLKPIELQQKEDAIEIINELVADKTVVITLYDLADYLDVIGYDWTVVEYAIDNTSGYYRGEAVSSAEERIQLLLDYGYTREAIINWYVDSDYTYSDAEMLVDSVINQ